jgi:hypothetical protein
MVKFVARRRILPALQALRGVDVFWLANDYVT